jgi:hypothetical protein
MAIFSTWTAIGGITEMEGLEWGLRLIVTEHWLWVEEINEGGVRVERVRTNCTFPPL